MINTWNQINTNISIYKKLIYIFIYILGFLIITEFYFYQITVVNIIAECILMSLYRLYLSEYLHKTKHEYFIVKNNKNDLVNVLINQNTDLLTGKVLAWSYKDKHDEIKSFFTIMCLYMISRMIMISDIMESSFLLRKYVFLFVAIFLISLYVDFKNIMMIKFIYTNKYRTRKLCIDCLVTYINLIKINNIQKENIYE